MKKELVQLIKSKNYKLNNTHIQDMARISHNKPVATKETGDKAKVNPGEYRDQKHRYKCQLCNISYEAKKDLTQHKALVHAQRHCIICKAQKYGDNNLNDHTQKCRQIRDKKRNKNDKKYKEIQKTKATYTNVYMHLMEDRPINEEKIREETKTKEAKKKQKNKKKNR